MIKRTFTLDEKHIAFLDAQANASETVRDALDAYIAGYRHATLGDVRADIAKLRDELHAMAIAAPVASAIEDDELSSALEALGL